MTEPVAPDRLVLTKSLYDQIIGHLTSWLPLEGCGLLSGVDRPRTFYPGTNIDASPTRYTMDPAEVIGAMKAMRSEDYELLAIVHSHPRTAAEPSPTDLAEAFYQDVLLLIVSFAGTDPVLQAWRLEGDQFASVPVQIVA